MGKEQTVLLKIEDMSDQGQGIGKTENGMVVFVPETVPGDIVYAQMTKVKKNYAFSKLVQILDYSNARTEEVCQYADAGHGIKDRCGGCSFGMLKYEAQLEIKENQVRSKLERLAGADFSEKSVFNKIIACHKPFYYRNKAVMPISTGGFITRKGGIQEPVHEPRIGFRPNKSNEVIDCKTCRLQAPTAMAAAKATRRFMLENHIVSYDKRWEKGLMHGMTVKTAFGTGEVMVIYDINGKGIPDVGKLIEYLDDSIYEAGGSLESVVTRSINKGGRKATHVVAGKPTILDTVEMDAVNGIREYCFEISADSFYQVNPLQMQQLYEVVRAYCKQAAGLQTEKPVLLDLYCGTGTIGLCVADLVEHVHGIEIVQEAVLDANRNATINRIVNATYECGKAEEIIPRWLGDGNRADIVVLDPPRAGCRPELLEAIAKAGIANIIYVSCDPATLARDIKLLTDGAAGKAGVKYKLMEVTPVDMFPHTGHVECVVLMSKANT